MKALPERSFLLWQKTKQETVSPECRDLAGVCSGCSDWRLCPVPKSRDERCMRGSVGYVDASHKFLPQGGETVGYFDESGLASKSSDQH